MQTRALDIVADAVRPLLAKPGDRLTVVGLCGAQGSGKSTIARAFKTRFDAEGLPMVILSIDDLYRTKTERVLLARTVHPLLRTRGVPGTHDVALGLDVIARLEHGEPALLPRFGKAIDDRLPEAQWERAAAGPRLLLLEGWCVGAIPQDDAALAAPVNALEAEEDPDGVWRRYANDALAGEYQALFSRIDGLAMLAAPSFDVVGAWRTQQEHALRAQGHGGMTDPQVVRFIQHYERLTRWMLREMPGRADVVIALGEDRTVLRADRR